MGGRDSTGTTLASMLLFEPFTNTWITDGAEMNTPRYMAACTTAAWYGNQPPFERLKIYVMGGQANNENAAVKDLDSMECYEPASNVRTTVGSAHANNGLYARTLGAGAGAI
jgi:hypothetical protein